MDFQEKPWRKALRWGFILAIVQRLILLFWMGIVALSFEQYIPDGLDFHNTTYSHLPTYESDAARAAFVVWRRWDGVHYLSLAQNGYLNGDLKTTVFPPLTPVLIRFFDVCLPGAVDFAGLVFATLSFGLYLTLLYRVCETYYQNQRLAPAAVLVAAFLPFSYFYNAPMSESLYMVMVMGMFYSAARERWWLVTVFGILATLVRLQGAALMGIALLLLLEKENDLKNWKNILIKGWHFALIPLGIAAFTLYRDSIGLPPMDEVYDRAYDIYFTNPLNGLLINLRFFIDRPLLALRTPDLLAFAACLILCGVMLRYAQHRHLPLVAYTYGHILIFVNKINELEWSVGHVEYSQSLARYSLALFPLIVLLADLFMHASKGIRLVMVVFSFIGFLTLSALHGLGAGIA